MRPSAVFWYYLHLIWSHHLRAQGDVVVSMGVFMVETTSGSNNRLFKIAFTVVVSCSNTILTTHRDVESMLNIAKCVVWRADVLTKSIHAEKTKEIQK